MLWFVDFCYLRIFKKVHSISGRKVHSRWIFPAKLLSRCKPAPPFLVIFTLSCFIREKIASVRKLIS
jgi:hypothetical protein